MPWMLRCSLLLTLSGLPLLAQATAEVHTPHCLAPKSTFLAQIFQTKE